ncbi:MAG: hypothetical protein AMXMBFR7_51220 [Planctomycetota bacterium]
MADLTGQTIAGYPIEKPIGKGSYGLVYQAQTSADPLAVKLLRDELRGDEKLNLALKAGWEKSQPVVHDNLVAIFGAGHEPPHGAYLLMELLKVKSLRVIVHAGMQLAWRDVLQICREIAKGLKALHDAGHAHGDLWPSNVLLTQDQDVKVEGAGALVTLTRPLTELLIPPAVGYQAPERLQGAYGSPGADLFALGGCLYFMLSGGIDPFPGNDAQQVALAILEKDPAPISAHRDDVSEELQVFLSRLLARDPVQRYGSADDVIAEIDRLRGGQPLEPLQGGAPAKFPAQPASSVRLASGVRAEPAEPAANAKKKRSDPFAFDEPGAKKEEKPADESSGALAAALLASASGENRPMEAPRPDASLSGARGLPVRPGRGLTSVGKLKSHIMSTIPQSEQERKGDDLFHQGQLPAALINWKDAVQKGHEHVGLRVKIELGEVEHKKQQFDIGVSEAKISMDVNDFDSALKHVQEAYDAALTERQREDAAKLKESIHAQRANLERSRSVTRMAVIAGVVVVLLLAAVFVLLRGGKPESPEPPSPAPEAPPPDAPRTQDEPKAETIPLPATDPPALPPAPPESAPPETLKTAEAPASP